MQGLVDHTVDRILCDPDVVEKVRQLKEEHGDVTLEFIYKFGLDGSKVKSQNTFFVCKHQQLSQKHETKNSIFFSLGLKSQQKISLKK